MYHFQSTNRRWSIS